MADTLHLKITTPERIVFEDEVDQVVLPTMMGDIGVLPHHIPLVSVLSVGELRITRKGQESSLAVSGGFIEVQPNIVTVLADTAEHAEEIDEQRAEEARKRAERLMKEKRADATDYAMVAAKLEKELARLRIVKKHKRSKVR